MSMLVDRPDRAATRLRQCGATHGEAEKVSLIEQLISHGCLKFGQFTLKSGQISPYYLDLRMIISNPRLLASVADAYASVLQSIDFERIAAIPLAALPIATAVSLKLDIPFVYPRMVAKQHGTGNSIEGFYEQTDRIVLLDDVISTAHSKLEAIAVLQAAGLKITDLVVLVDRESGGKEEVEAHGYHLHSYCRISEMLALVESRTPKVAGGKSL